MNKRQKLVLAISTVILIGLLVWAPSATAAQVTIESAAQEDHEAFESTGAAVVFVSDQVGYVFYLGLGSIADSGIPKYRKTTNGGASWGAAVAISSQDDIEDIGGIWYDRWTPGDSCGTTIHIAYTETDGMSYYNSLDTSSDSLSGEVTVSPNLGGFDQDDGHTSIVKATDGDLYIYVAGSSVQDVYKSTDGGSSWSSTSADTSAGGFLNDDSDQGNLMPLSGGDVLLTWYDINASPTPAIYSRVLSAAGTWDGASATVATDIVYYTHAWSSTWGASLYKSTGDIYLAVNDNPDQVDPKTANTNIRAYFYDESARSWSQETNVLTVTGTTDWIRDVKVSIDENTGDVYVVYHQGRNGGHFYYKKSTDGMTSWGSAIQLSSTGDDYRVVRPNLMSDERLYAVWHDDDDLDIFGETIADLAGGGGGGPPDVSGYSCYRTIRVDHTKISGTDPLANFPLLVKFENDSNLSAGTCGWIKNSDGWDIIFTDDSGTPTVQYDHEIEKFDGSAGTLFAWVRIPSLSATAYTDLRMWYGKSSATDTSNPTGVWDCNYKGVWHLKEDPSGTAPQMKDSTSNANHGTSYGSMTSGDQVAGMIGGALEFDGSNDEIRFSSAMLGDRTAWSITAWMQTATDDQGIYSEGNPSTGDYLMIRKDSYLLEFYLENPPYYPYFDGGTLGSNFHHVAIVQTSKSNRASFVDGGSKTSNSQDAGTINFTTSSIGLVRTDWTCCEFSGIIDEVRISNVARSDAWIEAEYKNVDDPNFTSVTYESCGLPQGEDPNTFSCSREIRIDHTKVSDLDGVSYYENFPMLVKFSGDNALKLGSCGEIHQADGSDIMFTDSVGTVLDHEIEEYDGTSGTLVAWVKIPQLNTTSATDITMHYGKETLQCGTDNPTGVWDDDYVGVWHFKESSGSGSYLKNSKQDAYHADPDSSSPFVADAKIAGGRDVNQIDFDSGGDLLDGDTAFTLSFWGYPNYASDAEWQADEAHMFNTDSMWGLRWSRNSGNDPGTGWIQADVKFTSGTNYFNHWNDLLRAQWNHIVLNYNGSALRWYINGSMVKQSTGYTGQALVSNSTTCLGYCWGGGGPGYVDELRYSRSARTAGWIATEYANQNDPSSFYSTISDTCGGGGGGTYSYCKKITIPRGNVSAPASPGYLANFPFLIKITNNNDLQNGVVSAEGWDIMFVDDSCGALSHEIESYDAGTGSLLAWVEIPQLNGPDLSSDTVIYMKYGNASMVCANDDPPGVWDDGGNDYYKGVWHLNDLTTSSTEDSTSNSNDGTKSAANEPTEVAENIEKAQDFGNDGSVDDYIDISSVSDDVDVDTGTFELWLKREFADSYGGGGGGTINQRISNDADDSEETISSGSIDWGSSDLELGEEGSAQIVGMRWRNITIPQGATITSAYIEFTVDEVQTGTPANVTFYGEAADNAVAFENVAYNISSAHYNNPTSASVAWNNIPGWDTVGQTKQSPDIKTIIQEIVDRGGWVSGNSLVVLVTGSGRRTADSHDSSPTTAPLLHVVYEEGGGTAPTMSIMRVDTDAENGITFAYDQEIEKFRFRHEAGNTEIKIERPSSEIPLNTWTHAAMTWDTAADEFKAYINGSQVGTTQTGLGTWAGTVTSGDLGRYGNQEYYDGSLDEVRISNIARSAEWIETAYDNQNNPESFITLGSCINSTIAVVDQWEEKF